MNFKKQHIAFIIFVALIFGGIGLFAGMQINQATLEQPQTLNNDKNGEQIENENENDNIDEEIEGLDKVSKAFSLIKENYLEEIDDKELIERSEEHTSELQSRGHLVCRLLLEKKKKKKI